MKSASSDSPGDTRTHRARLEDIFRAHDTNHEIELNCAGCAARNTSRVEASAEPHRMKEIPVRCLNCGLGFDEEVGRLTAQPSLGNESHVWI